jgi:hypothetical protein
MPYIGDNLQFIADPPRCLRLQRVLFLKNFFGSIFKAVVTIVVWEWFIRPWWSRHAIWPVGFVERAVFMVAFVIASFVVWLTLHIKETRWREELDRLNAEWREEARRGAGRESA